MKIVSEVSLFVNGACFYMYFLRPETIEITHVSSIPFASVGEHNRLGRHVDTNTKGLGGKQSLDQSFREEDLDNLLQYR